MNPMVMAALIQGGSQVASGFLPSGGDSPGGSDGYKEAQLNRKLAYDKEWSNFNTQTAKDLAVYSDALARSQTEWFNQNKTQWQVQDAIKAGLHPLFALGGGSALASSPALQVGGGGSDLSTPLDYGNKKYRSSDAVRDMGQSLATAMAARQTAEQREAAALGLDLLRSQVRKEDALASYYESQSAVKRQSNLVTKPLPSKPGIHVSELDSFHDRVIPKASEQISAKKGSEHIVSGGPHPMWKEYYLHQGNSTTRILLPYSEEGPTEGMDALHLGNPTALSMFIYANAKRYGGEHARYALSQYRKAMSRGRSVQLEAVR